MMSWAPVWGRQARKGLFYVESQVFVIRAGTRPTTEVMFVNPSQPQDAALPMWLRPLRHPRHEDLSQDAVVSVLTRARRSPQTPLTAAYFRRAVRNAELGEVRKRARRQTLESCNAPLLERRRPDGDPERRLLSRQLGEEIRTAIASLSAERREAVILYLRGAPLREVAQMLHVDRKRADNLVHRGLAALRSTLRARGITVQSTVLQ